MTTVKRGSEKLMSEDSGLTPLTADELSLVAGGISPYQFLIQDIWCPMGICGQDIFTDLSIPVRLDPTTLTENITLNFSRNEIHNNVGSRF